MPNFIEYQKSVSNELMSIRNRVRDFIGDRHWGEDGRFKEIILTDILKKHLPENVSIGTGFVVDNDNITSQIDIIIYDNTLPVMFKNNDFVIVTAESVVAIIEVKSKLTTDKAKEAIRKADNNAKIICKNLNRRLMARCTIGRNPIRSYNKNIFNGIFAFECESEAVFDNEGVKNLLKQSKGRVNYICFDKDYFLKHWEAGQPTADDDLSHYSIYKIDDLSFGYFISNLVEDIYIKTNKRGIPKTLEKMFYPIENTKEAHRIRDFDV